MNLLGKKKKKSQEKKILPSATVASETKQLQKKIEGNGAHMKPTWPSCVRLVCTMGCTEGVAALPS